MITIKRTNSEDNDFVKLVRALDKDLAIRNGDTNDFYAQFNKVDMIRHVLVAYQQDEPVGCGALKEYEPGSMEVKRMYVVENNRGQKVATRVLQELENWAKELNYSKCVLETGFTNPEAIGLYQKNNYIRIPNYGQYVGAANSICFEKILK